MDEDELRAHIHKFHPMKPHYRYGHAPNRMYLPSDVTVAAMYEDFVRSNGPRCSYETYRKAVRAQNISFTKLSGEECSRCSLQLNHLQGYTTSA